MGQSVDLVVIMVLFSVLATFGVGVLIMYLFNKRLKNPKNDQK